MVYNIRFSQLQHCGSLAFTHIL